MSVPTEETLVVVKPDGVRRGLVGQVIGRFEAKGFSVRRLELQTMSKGQAEDFYNVHKGKPIFPE